MDDDDVKIREWKAGFAKGVLTFVQVDKESLKKHLDKFNELECHAEGLDDGCDFIESIIDALAESHPSPRALKRDRRKKMLAH